CLCLGMMPPAGTSSVPAKIFCEPPFFRSILIVNGPGGTGVSLGLRTRCSPLFFFRISGVALLLEADLGCASFSAVPYTPKRMVVMPSIRIPNRMVCLLAPHGAVVARVYVVQR